MDYNEALRTIAELSPKIEESEGWKLHRRLRLLKLSAWTMERNYSELMEFLDGFANYKFATDLFRRREHFEAFADELYRRLHNYLASVVTLIDHSTAMVRSAYRRHPFGAEFAERVRAAVEESPRSQFVRGLRNYALHYRIPLATFSTITTLSEPGESAIYLSREKLLEYRDWKPASRRFLAKMESDNVDLRAVVLQHREDLDEFQGWVERRIREIHATQFAELHEMRARITEAERVRQTVIDTKLAKRAAEKAAAAAPQSEP